MRFWRCCGNAALILIALLKERSRQVLRRRPRASPPSGFGRRLARPVRPATGTAPIREQLNRRAPAATPRHGASQSGCPWSGRSRRWCWGEQARPASGSEVSHQPAGQAAARALPSGTPDSRAAGAYAGTPSVRPGSISADAGNRRAPSVGARERGAGMPRKFTAFVPRYQKFESISLQRRVHVSRDFALPRREAGSLRGYAGPAGAARSAETGIARCMAPTGGNISVGPNSSTAASMRRWLDEFRSGSGKAEHGPLLVPGKR